MFRCRTARSSAISGCLCSRLNRMSLAILLRRENPPPDSYIEWAPHSGALLSREVRGDPPPFYSECGVESSILEPNTVPGRGVMARAGQRRPCGPQILGGQRFFIAHTTPSHTHGSPLASPCPGHDRHAHHPIQTFASHFPFQPPPSVRAAWRLGSTRLRSRLPEPLTGLGLPVTIPRAFSRCCRSQLHIAADTALLLRVTSLARVKKISWPFAA